MNRAELEQKKASGVVLSAEEEAFLSSSEPDSTPESTPPTNQPPAPPTDGGPNRDRYIEVLEATLREQNRQISELMNDRRQAPPANTPPATDPEEEKQRFYNDPVNTTRSIIEQSLKEAIAPLNDFVRGLKIDGSPYSRMLEKFRADPRFSAALQDNQVLGAVEEIMNKAELTEVNMQSAIVHAMGLKTMGLLGTVAPPSNGNNAPAPTNPAPSNPAPSSGSGPVIPAHVRPSAAPTPQPQNNNAPRRPPLTENQRRLMREQGFKTEEEYYKWLELPAAEVAHTNFDKPQGGK